jgi:hypothetical protein
MRTRALHWKSKRLRNLSRYWQKILSDEGALDAAIGEPDGDSKKSDSNAF